jgi:hypothetical protein
MNGLVQLTMDAHGGFDEFEEGGYKQSGRGACAVWLRWTTSSNTSTWSSNPASWHSETDATHQPDDTVRSRGGGQCRRRTRPAGDVFVRLVFLARQRDRARVEKHCASCVAIGASPAEIRLQR